MHLAGTGGILVKSARVFLRPAAGGALLLLPLLAGCKVGPDYVPPQSKEPAGWTEAKAARLDESAAAAIRLRRWWNEFHDPTLDRLVERALRQNYDLKIATRLLAQARADRDIAAAGLYPAIGVSTTDGRFRDSTNVRNPYLHGVQNLFGATLDASWEIDIFGGTRRAVEAADATADAALENRRAVLVSLLGELGTDYAALRSAQEQLAIAERDAAALREAVALTHRQMDRGLSSELAVAQATGELEQVQAAAPALRATIGQTIHAIAVLLGEQPGEIEAELSPPASAMLAPPTLPAAIPSEVVRNRPDIRQAERQLAASNAYVGVAVAQLFPHFSLNPYLGTDSSWVNKVLTNGSLIWGLTATAAQPIFEGGRLDAQVAKAKAANEQSRLVYEHTVLLAFQEVEDAILGYATERRRHDALTAAVAAHRTALDRSMRLYKAGLADFLPVLDAERSLFMAEEALAQSGLTEVEQAINLFKAVGGGWQDIDPAGPDVAVARN